jgi:hypothetical protein
MRPLIPCVLAGLLLSAIAEPTIARPLEHEHYSGSDSFTAEDLCGTDWNVDVTFSGNFMLKAGRAGDPTPYFFDNYEYYQVWTDANDPSHSVIHEGNGLYKDLRITLVEGTIHHFQALEAGQPSVWRSLDGAILFRDRGSIIWEFTVDTKGDDDLDNDEFLDFEGPTVIRGPHPELTSTEEEFCAAIT